MKLEYVSAVEPGWLDSVFFPQIAERLADSELAIVWIATESCNEGNYLLEKIKYWTVQGGRRFDEIVVSINDPLAAWEDLFGTASERGALCDSGKTIGILNGCFLPADFLTEHFDFLNTVCQAKRIHLLLPIFYATTHLIRGILRNNSVILVPRFGSFAEDRRIELFEQIFLSLIPNMPAPERHLLSKKLVRNGPSSRAEAEAWAGYYASSDFSPSALLVEDSIPPIDRFPTLPPGCPKKEQLASAIRGALLKLDEASNLFQNWQGRPLVKKIESITDPFQIDSPLWWFVASVSTLSSQLFDGVDPAFDFLAGYDLSNKVPIATSPDPFFANLRTIRTVFQHGLEIGDDRNGETIENARSWFSINCGNRYPVRADWRRLTMALINELDSALSRMREVLRCMQDWGVRASITAQLQQFERRLSKDQWRRLLADAISRINPVLDPELMLDKFLATLQKDLRLSPVGRDGVLVTARFLAETVVTTESARCPLDSEDLRGLGLNPGALWGRAKAYGEKLWDQTPSLTREDLKARLVTWLAGSEGQNRGERHT